MFFVAVFWLAGLLYAAGHHELGSLGVTLWRYGRTFCDAPSIRWFTAGVPQPEERLSACDNAPLVGRDFARHRSLFGGSIRFERVFEHCTAT